MVVRQEGETYWFEIHGIQTIRNTGTENRKKKLWDVTLDPGEYETSGIIKASERVTKDETPKNKQKKNQKKS